MKQWESIQTTTNTLTEERKIGDIYKSEILDTRVVVSAIFSDFRMIKETKDYRPTNTRSIATKKK